MDGNLGFKTMKIGYARCSTADQNLDWQLDALKKEGCDEQHIFQEKASGVKRDRPELELMLRTLRPGDTLVVCELTRLSRSTKDLFELVDKISSAGADIKSLKESWLDTTTPHGKLLFTIFAGVSQFERGLYTRWDKEPVTEKQIWAVVLTHPETFVKSEGRIRLMI